MEDYDLGKKPSTVQSPVEVPTPKDTAPLNTASADQIRKTAPTDK